MKASLYSIGFGDPGVESTLRHMRRLVVASARDPIVIGWAQDIVRFSPERDPDAAAQAFLSWIRANFRYTEDPIEVESVKTPEAMIREYQTRGKITGDCDDQVTLLSAGLNAIGVETQFVVVAADAGYPDDFSHVLMQYAGRGGWTTADPIVRGTGLGWFPPKQTRIGAYGGSGFQTNRARSGSAHEVRLGLAVVVAGLWFLSRSRRR